MREEICLQVLSNILVAGFMGTPAGLEFDHDKSHQMRNARCEMRDAPSFERP